MSTLEKFNPVPDSPPALRAWSQVKYWVTMAGNFTQGSLAAQVMAGFALAELQKANQVKPGQPKKVLPHDVVILSPSASPADSAKLSWPELVEKNTGISDETARRWIAMAEGVRYRWQQLAPEDKLCELMRVPAGDWKDNDTRLVSDALARITDGRTQLGFLRELGVARKIESRPKASRPASHDSSTVAVASTALEQARLDSLHMADAIQTCNQSFTLVADDDELQLDTQISVLEFALRLRHKYRLAPGAKRAAVSAEIRKLIRLESPLK